MTDRLTEEELARLDRVVATWADLGTDGVSLPWRELEAVLVALPALLDSARAVRKVKAMLKTLREQHGSMVATSAHALGVINAVKHVEAALTATAEPTAGEDDHG